jgi:hypothetical protein
MQGFIIHGPCGINMIADLNDVSEKKLLQIRLTSSLNCDRLLGINISADPESKDRISTSAYCI